MSALACAESFPAVLGGGRQFAQVGEDVFPLSPPVFVALQIRADVDHRPEEHPQESERNDRGEISVGLFPSLTIPGAHLLKAIVMDDISSVVEGQVVFPKRRNRKQIRIDLLDVCSLE